MPQPSSVCFTAKIENIKEKVLFIAFVLNILGIQASRAKQWLIMGDPLSVASGLIAVVTATLQSSKILYETIQSFRNHRTAVLDLVRELKGLESVLSPLQDHVRSDETAFLPLKVPLIQCRQACVDFQILIEQNSRRTRAETRTSLRDWAKLMYMNGDIVSFKELLAGYKGTITIALADANLLVARPKWKRFR
jgi:hypothetical protein